MVDIAYHVGVDRNGNIYELRTTQIAGDTATDYDTTGHFLVLCEGDFDQEAISDAQLHGAALAFAWATQTFHIGTDTLAGHRDLAQTSCPGANLYAHLSSGDLKRRIDDLVAAGQSTCSASAGPMPPRRSQPSKRARSRSPAPISAGALVACATNAPQPVRPTPTVDRGQRRGWPLRSVAISSRYGPIR